MLAAVFCPTQTKNKMGVDTKAIIRKGVTVTEFEQALKAKYENVIVDAADNVMFRFFFNDGNDQRTLWTSYSGSCLRENGIDGIWCSLGMWGNAVQIMRYLCETFGGYLDENDCDDEGFYPINFHLYQQAKEYSEMDLFTNKIIAQLGYINLQKALLLFNEFKGLSNGS